MNVGEVVDTVSAYNRGRTWLGFICLSFFLEKVL